MTESNYNKFVPIHHPTREQLEKIIDFIPDYWSIPTFEQIAASKNEYLMNHPLFDLTKFPPSINNKNEVSHADNPALKKVPEGNPKMTLYELIDAIRAKKKLYVEGSTCHTPTGKLALHNGYLVFENSLKPPFNYTQVGDPSLWSLAPDYVTGTVVDAAEAALQGYKVQSPDGFNTTGLRHMHIQGKDGIRSPTLAELMSKQWRIYK